MAERIELDLSLNLNALQAQVKEFAKYTASQLNALTESVKGGPLLDVEGYKAQVKAITNEVVTAQRRLENEMVSRRGKGANTEWIQETFRQEGVGTALKAAGNRLPNSDRGLTAAATDLLKIQKETKSEAEKRRDAIRRSIRTEESYARASEELATLVGEERALKARRLAAERRATYTALLADGDYVSTESEQRALKVELDKRLAATTAETLTAERRAAMSVDMMKIERGKAQERVIRLNAELGLTTTAAELAGDRIELMRRGNALQDEINARLLGFATHDERKEAERRAAQAKAFEQVQDQERRRATQINARLARFQEENAARELKQSAQLEAARRARIEAERLAAETTARSTRVTMFQRVQARFSANPNADPQSFQTMGGFIGRRALTTAGYALPSALLYGGARAIRELTKEASELEVQFSLVESQFDSFGGSLISGTTGATVTMSEFRDEILKTARETGVEADKLADTARQMAGAFSSVDEETGIRVPDFGRALRETAAAAEISRVTSLDLQDVTDAVTATTIAFEGQGLSVREIGDLLVGLEARYGVLGAELINFTADLAPLGAELQFTAEQLTALGAVAQRVSGRSGAVLAEQFGRILPALQENRIALIDLIGTNSDTADSQIALTQAFAAGDGPAILRTLVEEYQSLDSAQKNALVSIAGGRREASTLFSILADGQATLEALNSTTAGDFAGQLGDRFTEVKDTVSFAFTELRRVAEELGLAIFDAGLADALILTAQAASTLIGFIEPLVAGLSALNDVAGGIPLQFLAITAAIKGLRSVTGSLNLARLIPVASLNRFGSTAALRTAGLAGPGVPGGLGTLGSGMAGAGAGLGRMRSLSGLKTATTGLLSSLGPQAAIFAGFIALETYFSNAREQSDKVNQAAVSAKDSIDSAFIESEGAGFERLDELERQAREGLRGQNRRNKASGIEGFIVGTGLSVLDLFADEIGGQDIGLARQQAATGSTEYDQILGQVAARRAAENIGIVEDWLDADAAAIAEALNKTHIDGLTEEQLDNMSLEDLARPVSIGIDADITDQWLNELRDIGVSFDVSTPAVGPSFEIPDQLSLTSDFLSTSENIRSLVDLARQGNLGAIELLEAVMDQADGVIEDISPAIEASQDLTDAADRSKERAESMENALSQYESGLITGDAVIDAINANISSKRQLLEAAEGDPEFLEEMRGKLRDAQEQLDNIISDRVDTDLAVAQLLAEATGEGDLDEASIASLENALRESINRGGSLDQLSKYTSELIMAERSAIEARIAEAETLEEALGIANNAQFSEMAVLAAGIERLRTSAVQDSLTRLGDILEMTADEISSLVVEGFSLRGQSAADTLLYLTSSTIKEKAAARKAAAAAKRMFAGMGRRVGPRGRVTYFDPNAVYEKELDQIQKDAEAEAKAALKIAKGMGDIFSLDMDLDDEIADYDSGSSSDAAQEALNEANALLDIEEARAGSDAVKLASIAQQRAAVAKRYAATTAEHNQALAAAIEADREMASAMFEVFESSVGIQIAMAEASGNEVEAARRRLEVLKEQQRRAASLGLGEAGENNLAAEVISAEARLRDAQISAERERIDYEMAIGNMSRGQAIAALEALLAVPEITEKEIREINLAIKSLRDQLGSDYQFNLPTTLGLPTAYEVRRLGQTPGGASGYTDNRQITINFSATGTEDAQQIAEYIVGEFSRPSRFGTVPRRS